MNTLTFKIVPNVANNDHEVQIFADGKDILQQKYIGIDPIFFFAQPTLPRSGRAIVGRCFSCGVIGCNDYAVEVEMKANKVLWTDVFGTKFIFDKIEYSKLIQYSQTDFSWENIERRIERITSVLLKNSIAKEVYKFDWISARSKKNILTLSYTNVRDQTLFELDWDGLTQSSAVEAVKQFLETNLK